MVSNLLLIHLNKGTRKRKDPHPGLPSRRKKDSEWFLLFSNFLHGSCCGLSQSSFDALFVCLLVCFCFVLIKKKNGKIQKTMCVCVYWYLCTLDGLWNKVSQLCITCSLDEHLHALLSNLSFMALLCYFYDLADLIFHILNHYFWREWLENPKRKA